MSEYNRIKATCFSLGKLWEDPSFPATQSSVFYHQVPNFNFEWKRPKELFKSPAFVRDNCFDVVPGSLDLLMELWDPRWYNYLERDNWLASGFGVLYMVKDIFQFVVPHDQGFDQPNFGVYRFRLWWCNKWVEVCVDDQLPTVNGRLAFLQSKSSEQFWPALLEKAYAKLHGSYEALKYSNLLDVLSNLTGGLLEALPMFQVPDVDTLQNMLRYTSVITCVANNDQESSGFDLIKPGVNYRVCNVETVETSQGCVNLVRLYRPLGLDETQNKYIMRDTDKWRIIPLRERSILSSIKAGFWMLFSEFQDSFSQLDIIHLDTESCRDELTLRNKQRWHQRVYDGSWKRGVTAGGCRNNIEFFHMNPQIQMTLAKADTVVVSLNQHCIMEPKVIGFSVFEMNKMVFTETVPPEYFSKFRNGLHSHYTNSKQIGFRWFLQAGTYLIMPTTFKHRQEANFTVRVLSTRPQEMTVLDSPTLMLRSSIKRALPGFEIEIFNEYEAVFVQMADEHKTLDAFGLHDLLEMCLPNDYIKSCATIDTCRQIILTMDTKRMGRISISDFKDLLCSLKYWEDLFQKYAKERRGVLREERLRDALKEVGFILPQRAFALLLQRYMRKDGMLRFGDFVSAVLHLQRAFSVFDANKEKSGIAEMNLSQWLRCSLMT